MELPSNSDADYYEIVHLPPPTIKNYPELIRNYQNNNYNSENYMNNNNGILPPITTSRTGVDPNLAIWAVVDGVLLVFILGGNILTILAVRYSRRLRSVISNMFVLSLAISDILVGFTLPYHLAFYMGSTLGQSKQLCLLRFFLIILACCNSIWNLIAIAVDRYIAIFYPLHYNRYMTKRVALILLGFGWILGTAFALIPMFWNNWETATQCEFDEILKPWYIAGVITPGFSMIWLCMLIVYWRIWREASKHAKQLRSSFTGLHETHSDSKSVQVVLFILGCFSVCWLPYFIIACVQIFKIWDKSTPMIYKAVFSLAMANSGMNPIIYAWKNSGFRRAFARLLRCQSPDFCDTSQQYSIRSNNNNHNIQRKSSSIQHHEIVQVPAPPDTPTYFSKNTNINNNEVKIVHPKLKIHNFHEIESHIINSAINPEVKIIKNDDKNEEFKELPRIKSSNELTAPATKYLETNLDKNIDMKSTLNNCQNLVIEKIERDNNGNCTQIHIFRSKTLKYPNSGDDSYELTLNCRNFKQTTPQNHVQFAQLCNGKHIIHHQNQSTDQIQNEII